MKMYDHKGNPVKHGRARVNGIIMHYVTAGEGEPLLLLHGTPKSSSYWYKLIPLLTDKFKVIAPDLRGFGHTDIPGASEGYDSLTNVKDIDELMVSLGIDKFHIHSEDRGAEFGFVYAATHPEKVKTISYCEMAVSGFGIEEASYFTEENVMANYNKTGKWLWHVPFFFVQNIPELLLQGHEYEFWEILLKASAYDPDSLDKEFLDDLKERFLAPGAMRGILETYRAELKNMKINKEIVAKGKLKLPVMTVGGMEFYGTTVKDYALRIFDSVERSEVIEECGHNLAIEQAEKLAEYIRGFMLDRK